MSKNIIRNDQIWFSRLTEEQKKEFSESIEKEEKNPKSFLYVGYDRDDYYEKEMKVYLVSAVIYIIASLLYIFHIFLLK